jgi:chitin synthase
MLVEIGHTLGITLFLFKVLPCVDNLTGLFLINAICLIPGVLKIIFSTRRNMTRFKKFTTFVFDTLAIIAQFSVWFIFSLVDNIGLRNGDEKLKGTHVQNDYFNLHLILSTFLISLSWWENFSQVRYSTNKITLFIQSQINELRKHNARIYLLVNPIKIALMFLFSYMLMPAHLQAQYANVGKRTNLTVAQSKELIMSTTGITSISAIKEIVGKDLFFSYSGFFMPFFIHAVSSALCFYTARIACKVLMQGLGFSLPLALATPVTFLVLMVSSLKAQFDYVTMFRDIFGAFFYWDGFNRNFFSLSLSLFRYLCCSCCCFLVNKYFLFKIFFF